MGTPHVAGSAAPAVVEQHGCVLNAVRPRKPRLKLVERLSLRIYVEDNGDSRWNNSLMNRAVGLRAGFTLGASWAESRKAPQGHRTNRRRVPVRTNTRCTPEQFGHLDGNPTFKSW